MPGTNGGAQTPSFDCGTYCGEGTVLAAHSVQIADLARRQLTVDERSGETLNAAIRAEKAAERAEHAANRSRIASESVAAKFCEPANALLEKYQADSNPPLGEDVDASEVTQTTIMSPRAALNRIRKAEKDARESEQERVKIEVAKALAEKEKEDAKARAERAERARMWLLAATPVLLGVGAAVKYAIELVLK